MRVLVDERDNTATLTWGTEPESSQGTEEGYDFVRRWMMLVARMAEHVRWESDVPSAYLKQLPEVENLAAEELTAAHERPSFLEPAQQRLAELARLEADWDSYGAEPVSDTAIWKVRLLLKSVEETLGGAAHEEMRPYAIAPVADGGVQVEWRRAGETLEVEAAPVGHLGYLYVRGEGDNRTFVERDNVPLSEVLDLLNQLLVR